MRVRKGNWAFGTLSRFALVGLIGGGTAACSSDAMRFADPMANPFASNARGGAEPVRTGSLPDRPTAAPVLRTETVQSQPLAAPQSRPLAAAPVHAASTPRPAPLTGGAAGWSARGGTPITVATGDSLATISNRYGVPGAAILSANNLASAAQVSPGRQIVIPVYQASSAEPAASATPRAVASAHQVPAQTKFRLAEGPKPAPQREAAVEVSKKTTRPGQSASKNEDAKAAERLSNLRERVAKLEEKKAQAAASVKEAKLEKAAKAVEAKAKPEPIKVAKAEAPKAAKVEPKKIAKVEAKAEPSKAVAAKAPEPQKVASLAPAKVAAPEPAKPAIKEPEQTASIAQKPADDANFRWPARGRVINGYGSSGNEGINIAVPDGTPVKAAEEGTVAYAGSDVKGYGNLVLIRHANGFVSAYAHNGEINVKPGEKVKRGQVVAKSGQSGNVTSPQLHFEIRKGATPVDPIPHLASN